MIEVKIPSPGESITEVEIANWLVEDGDYVEKDQELAEIESDKATLPLVAEESGKIEIIAPEGETIKVGAVACKIDTEAEPEEKPAEAKEEEPEKEEPEEKSKEEKKERKEQKEGKKEKETSETTKEEKPEKESEKKADTESTKVTPVAKKMMEEYDLSIDDVIKGLRRITKQDVEMAREGLSQPEQQESEKAAKKTFSRESDRQKMSNLRKKLSQRLVSVKNETAMLTTFNEVDMTEVIRLRKKYQKEFQEQHGIKLGFMSFFIKAVSKALDDFPNVNSWIDGDDVVYPQYKDIGIAVQTPKGLMVPVIRNAESLTVSEIELKVNDFAQKAKKNRISIDEMEGGTFTITNGGVFGSLLSTPIINPPQSGILGMHNIQERPVAVDGKVEIRPMMYIALSYDHRTIDGKDSVSFLVRVKELIETPHKMMMEGNDPDKRLLGL